MLAYYPQAQDAALAGLEDMLRVANTYARADGAQEARVARTALKDCFAFQSWPDAIVLPPTLSADPPAFGQAEIVAVNTANEAGVTLAAICGSVFLLAEAGLLTGRPASVHQLHAEPFARRFPGLQMRLSPSLIDLGSIITCSGPLDWPNIGLTLIERFIGPEIAARTAADFSLAYAPPEPTSFRPVLTHGDAAILKLQRWLSSDLARNADLAAMAKQAAMSRRTLARRFFAATGMTPHRYVQELRLDRARALLLSGQTPIERVAHDSGFTDASHFRRAFRAHSGLSPQAFRLASAQPADRARAER